MVHRIQAVVVEAHTEQERAMVEHTKELVRESGTIEARSTGMGTSIFGLGSAAVSSSKSRNDTKRSLLKTTKLPYYHIWTCNPRFYSSYRSLMKTTKLMNSLQLGGPARPQEKKGNRPGSADRERWQLDHTPHARVSHGGVRDGCVLSLSVDCKPVATVKNVEITLLQPTDPPTHAILGQPPTPPP